MGSMDVNELSLVIATLSCLYRILYHPSGIQKASLTAAFGEFVVLQQKAEKCRQLLAETNTPPISLEEAADTIVRVLEDPAGQFACGLKLNSAVEKLFHAMRQEGSDSQKMKVIESKAKRFVESYPNVVRAAVKFVTKKQTPADHSYMVDNLVVCRCDRSDRIGYARMHDSFHYGVRVLLPGKWLSVYASVAFLTDMMAIALNGLSRGRFRREKSGIPAKNQPWPQGLDDLLPYGFADSVDGLDLWASHTDYGNIILKLAGSIIQHEPKFAAAIMSKGPDYTFGIHRPAQHIARAMDEYDVATAFPDRLAKSDHSWFTYPIKYVFTFTNVLKLGGMSQYMNMLATGGKLFFRPVLLRALTVFSLPSMVIRYPEEFSNVNLLLAQINGRQQDALWCAETLTVPINECYYILQNTCRGGCCNIACPTPDAEPKKCANCGLMKYCSRQCQTDAWNHPTHPHKGLCRKIKSLKEQLGRNSWDFLKGGLFRGAELDALLKKKRINPSSVMEIALEIAAIQSLQYGHRERQ